MMKRNILIFVLLCVAFSGSFVAAVASTYERDFNLRGYVNATRTQDLPFRIPRLGVNAELTQYTKEELVHNFDMMQQIGVTWIRQFVFWNDRFDWETIDTIVDTLQDFPNLQLVVVLTDSSPPEKIDGFVEFVREFATRYGQHIHYYQIWDEPNIYSGWGKQIPNPTQYAALLSESYDAIHTTDENATVIVAALAPTTETGPKNLSDIEYLTQLYVYGLSDFSDAVAAKPYGFEYSPTERTVDKNTLNFSRIIALREIMEANGDGKKPLWASNWGWNSLPDNWNGQPSIWGQVSESEQSVYTLDALDRVEREWPWLGGMILSHWQPHVPPDDPQWGFSILQQDSTPGTLWHILADYETHAVASNGLYAPRNPYVQYSGTWTFSDLGADIGWTQDSKLEFEFVGSDVSLLVREGDYVVYFYPDIDGMEANAGKRDVSGNSYILLRSGDLAPQMHLIPIANNLSNTTHTLTITTDELVPNEISHRWPLVGYAVTSGNLREPYDRQIIIGWITTLITGAGVLISAASFRWSVIISPINSIWKQLGDLLQALTGVFASFALLAGMFATWQDGTPTIFRREPVQIGLSILTAGIIYINEFSVVLTLASILLLFFVIYDRLDIGLMLTILWAPFFLSPVELYKFAFPVAEIILLITFAAWLIKSFVEWGQLRQNKLEQATITIPKGKLNYLDVFVFGWLLLGCFSLIWSGYKGPAITELRTMFIQPVMFYIVLRSTSHHSKSTIQNLVVTITLAGLGIAAIGLLMWFQGNVIEAEGGAQRLTSVYGSPNNVALIIGRTLPFVVTVMLLPFGKRFRLMSLCAFLPMAVAMILTKSAGGLFIGVPFSIFGILVLVFKKQSIKPIVIVLILIAIGLIIALQSPRFSRITDFSEGTSFYRIRVWQSAVNMIEDKPLTGFGLDQFLYAYRDEYILPDAWEEPNLSHPHNFILDIWTRLGLLGLIIFVGIQSVFWRKAMKLYRHFENTQYLSGLAIIIGTMGSMINLLAHGSIDNSIFVIDLAYVFILIVAIPIVYEKIISDGKV